jgi:hypothetical protein
MMLSILICSIDGREEMLSNLVCFLDKQGGGFKGLYSKQINGCSVGILTYPEHEIIFAIDNRVISTGTKRQLLLDAAKGHMISFIDEDDEVPDYYLEEGLNAAKSGMDCASMYGEMTTNGSQNIGWFLAKDNPNSTIKKGKDNFYLRTTNHLSFVKRELALLAGFKDISNGEDKAYSEALNPYLKTEYAISRPMYHYKFISTNKSYK